MRIHWACSALALVLAAGCHSNQVPVAVSAAGSTGNPVGPVPGGIQPTGYRTNPYSNDAVALQDGRRLFNWYNCSGCHGGHAGGGMGPSLRDPEWLYGNRDDQVYDSISHGRSQGMPAWGSRVPDSQIWELVAYIKSLGTPQEPDPPTEPADEMVQDPNGKTVTGATVHPVNPGTDSPDSGQ